MAGEHVVVLPGLGTDGPGSPAARLFIERALDADSTVDFGEAELEAVAEIVERLDGMPLAIELAAARTRSMRPGQILAHLDDRFGILIGAVGPILASGPSRRRSCGPTTCSTSTESAAAPALAVCAGPVTLETTARLLGLDELTASCSASTRWWPSRSSFRWSPTAGSTATGCSRPSSPFGR